MSGPAVEIFSVEELYFAGHGFGEIADFDVFEPDIVAVVLKCDVSVGLGSEAVVLGEFAFGDTVFVILRIEIEFKESYAVEEVKDVIVFDDDACVVELSDGFGDFFRGWFVEGVATAEGGGLGWFFAVAGVIEYLEFGAGHPGCGFVFGYAVHDSGVGIG